ncbi:17299_t:CDS:2 [Acaulospora colombiana]|uniref:17299_t:CDS:1 n=1 Tax=Acaulospora colombiana TaxID=27376 RepID=A0ACA9NZ92_9GLOM|nr:17299_t:CDS:2 [Acaulospora colombiana]
MALLDLFSEDQTMQAMESKKWTYIPNHKEWIPRTLEILRRLGICLLRMMQVISSWGRIASRVAFNNFTRPVVVAVPALFIESSTSVSLSIG